MKNLLIVSIALAAVLLTACTNKSLDDKFNKKTYMQDIAKLSEKKILNDSAKLLLIAYIDSNMKDSLKLSVSYSKLLQDAKVEDKIKKDKEAKRKLINEQVVVKISKKYMFNNVLRNGVYYNELWMDGNITNNTDRSINGIIFSVTYSNSQKKKLYYEEWTLDKVIKPKSQIKINLSAGVIDSRDENRVAFKIAELSKLIFEYQINKLMFDDGTSIDVK